MIAYEDSDFDNEDATPNPEDDLSNASPSGAIIKQADEVVAR